MKPIQLTEDEIIRGVLVDGDPDALTQEQREEILEKIGVIGPSVGTRRRGDLVYVVCKTLRGDHIPTEGHVDSLADNGGYVVWPHGGPLIVRSSYPEDELYESLEACRAAIDAAK